MKKPVIRVATIHDLCGIGKAALTNVIPVLATLGVESCPIPTMILSTHTGGFNIPKIVKLQGYISEAFKHYEEINVSFEGIFIGYLGSVDNINDICTYLNKIEINDKLIVLDPIFADNGNYYTNFNNNYSESLKKLIKFSKIITPNFTEACILANIEIPEYVEKEKLKHISKELNNLGCERVIITSIPLKDKNKIGTSIYNGKTDEIHIIISERLKKSYPGTGDIFTSVLIGRYLIGDSLLDSVKQACTFVEKCIIESSKYDYPTKEGILLEASLKYLIKS